MILLQINVPSDWELFFGHFHPVVVHLPIGILIIAFMLEMIRMKTNNETLNQAVIISLSIGFITAVISCLFGWLLSQSGGYNESTLFWHQWLGISVAAIAGIAWLIKKRSTSTITSMLSKIYVGLLCLMVLLITFTGHLGGNMTHGEGYLTVNTPQPFRKWLGIEPKTGKEAGKKFTDINEAVVYRDLVAPVMEVKCWSCHNATKTKGGLRMDIEELLLKGGKHGAVIKANDDAGSEIIKRLLLPVGDDQRMPPKGKIELTAEEILLVKWWIANGASMKAKVKDLPKKEAVTLYLKTIPGTAGSGNNKPVSDAANAAPESLVLGQKIASATKVDIDALRKENLIINPVSQGQLFLEVSAVNNPGFDDAKMKLLNKIPQQLVWLKLSGTKITDGGLKEISNCKNLLKLNIEGTAITDAGIGTIKQLQNLEYLNIIATKIDDNGLLELTPLKKLKNIYCWQTGITAKGIKAFKKLNPSTFIESGN